MLSQKGYHNQMKFTFQIETKTRLDIFLRSELVQAVSVPVENASITPQSVKFKNTADDYRRSSQC